MSQKVVQIDVFNPSEAFPRLQLSWTVYSPASTNSGNENHKVGTAVSYTDLEFMVEHI